MENVCTLNLFAVLKKIKTVHVGRNEQCALHTNEKHFGWSIAWRVHRMEIGPQPFQVHLKSNWSKHDE